MGRLGRFGIILFLTLSVVLLFGLLPAFGQGAGTGTISGTVTDINSGDGLIGVSIYAYPVDSDGNDDLTRDGGYGQTGLQGAYQIPDLAPGSYIIEFFPWGSEYQGMFYDNAKDWDLATIVNVVAGQDSPDVDAVLELGTCVSGTITDPSGNPVPDVWVCAYPVDDSGNYDASRVRGSAFTNPDGTYQTTGLAPGKYIVEILPDSDVYLGEYYSDKKSWETATAIDVIQGQDKTGINEQLERAATITGKITSPTGSLVGQYIDISVNPVDDNGDYDSSRNGGSAQADSSGNYQVTGLAPGKYKIQFWPEWTGANYEKEYYSDKRTWSDATIITLASGDTFTANEELEIGGSISGTISVPAGNPFTGAGVGVYPVKADGSEDPAREGTGAYVGPDGKYKIEGLAPGTYKVDFSPMDSIYVYEFYNNKRMFDIADIVTVSSGTDTVANESLEIGGRISGCVKGKPTDTETLQSLEDVWVEAIPVADIGLQFTYGHRQGTYTDCDGNYSLLGLGTGYYKIRFDTRQSMTSDAAAYIPEYYNGAAFFEDADIVYVTEGDEVPSINATLTVGGVISGKVTDSSGDPIADVKVRALPFTSDYSGEGPPPSVSTLPDGTYEIKGLVYAKYRLCFYPPFDSNYTVQYFSDKYSWTSADTVTVEKGSTATADATLTIGGSVAGKVTDLVGHPLKDVGVSVYPVDSKGDLDENREYKDSFDAITDSNGDYQAKRLVPGIYKVDFILSLSADLDITQYYNTKNSWDQADTITVTAGATTTANATFQIGGNNSGGGSDGGGGGSSNQGPAAPQGLKANTAKNMVHLVWNPNKESNLAGYNVYRKDGDKVELLNTGGLIHEVQYQDKSPLKPGAHYTYYVTAVDTDKHESAKKEAKVEVTIPIVKGEVVFADVPSNAWYKDAVSRLASQEILGGYKDGSFKPNKNITRAEFAKMICLAMGWTPNTTASAWFTDVGKASWEFGYVETARAHGVIGGYKDGTFKPNKNITRAEIAKIIAETLDLPAGSSALNDIGSSWAKGYINSCVKAGIIKGYSDNTFRANNTATRAEAASMITGMLDAK